MDGLRPGRKLWNGKRDFLIHFGLFEALTVRWGEDEGADMREERV